MLFQAMLSCFEDYARTRKCVLGALKDIPQPVDAGIDRVIKGHGYAPLGGMPTAWLAIDFNDMDSYFARLSSSTRKDMRRKLRARERSGSNTTRNSVTICHGSCSFTTRREPGANGSSKN